MMTLATEDILSEAVGERLVDDVGAPLMITQRVRRSGFGYLKSRMQSWKQMSQWTAIFLITDLDRAICPTALINEWAGNFALPEDFLFRVAVREVESWLLADQASIAALLGISIGKIPPKPDELVDPKQVLLELAARAPRTIRNDLVADINGTLSQGLGYNARLSEHVRETWSPIRASARSPSLARARMRLTELAKRKTSG